MSPANPRHASANPPKDAKASHPDAETMGFEDAVAELESIIERIDAGEVGLEASLDAYRRGAALVRRCRAILDSAQQEIERISAADLAARGADGNS
ncbi:MAG: exodeoxyribonuclease VII small subunit [Phycisphaerales bacterium]|nr:exodeoxyribonuclease VII small subunit [Phycisphaerales bacterium]